MTPLAPPRTPVLLAALAALAAALAGPTGATPAAAQTVQGTVLEEDGGTAVFGADVVVLDDAGRGVGRATTDVTGGFLLALPETPTFRLSVRHPGYRPYTSEPLDRPAVDIRVEIRLGVEAIALEPLTVTATRSADEAHLADFEARRTDPGRVGGFFVTRDDIESRPMALPSQLLVGFAGVRVQQVITAENPFGLDRSLIYLRGARGEECLANVYVDGIRTRQSVDHTVDDLLESENLGGVEVYSRAVTAPLQYQADPGCGVVLFWTRRPQGGGTWSPARIAVGAAAVLGLILGGLTLVN